MTFMTFVGRPSVWWRNYSTAEDKSLTLLFYSGDFTVEICVVMGCYPNVWLISDFTIKYSKICSRLTPWSGPRVMPLQLTLHSPCTHPRITPGSPEAGELEVQLDPGHLP